MRHLCDYSTTWSSWRLKLGKCVSDAFVLSDIDMMMWSYLGKFRVETLASVMPAPFRGASSPFVPSVFLAALAQVLSCLLPLSLPRTSLVFLVSQLVSRPLLVSLVSRPISVARTLLAVCLPCRGVVSPLLWRTARGGSFFVDVFAFRPKAVLSFSLSRSLSLCLSQSLSLYIYLSFCLPLSVSLFVCLFRSLMSMSISLNLSTTMCDVTHLQMIQIIVFSYS